MDFQPVLNPLGTLSRCWLGIFGSTIWLFCFLFQLFDDGLTKRLGAALV
jgi:hypothetical protein